MSKLRTTVIAVLVVGLVGYAFGRYLQPAKVVTKVETKVKVVEVEVEKTKTEVRTIVKEVVKPDGTKVKETITENIEESKKKTKNQSEAERSELKVVENVKPQWKAQVQVGLETIQVPSYRVGIERRVFGPIFAGAYSRTDFKDYGISISMEF